MTPGRSTWPVVLLLGVCVSLLLGTAAAVAAPSKEGRPWWHDGKPARVTGTVVEVDPGAGTFTLDGLTTYDPVRAGIGTLSIEAPADQLATLHARDTVDVVVERHDGTWRLRSAQLLDPD